MKHKRQQILTAILTFNQFEKRAYSVRTWSGVTLINLKNGYFGYQAHIENRIDTHAAFMRAHTVANLNGKVIAKRKSPDQPLRRVQYKLL